MGVCERCRILCPSTIIRQGDEALCDVCETHRVRTLEAEHQQRKTRSALRSASASGCTSGPSPAADESTSAVSIPQEAQQPGADASDVTATIHPTDVTTQPHSKVDQAAADAQGPLSPAESLHCHSQFKVGRTSKGDMIRCCLCFRWHHEQCITDGFSWRTHRGGFAHHVAPYHQPCLPSVWHWFKCGTTCHKCWKLITPWWNQLNTYL